jgi:hypothetical protein
LSESCGFREFSLDPSPATYGVSVESFQFRMTLRAETTRMIRPFKTIRRRFHLLLGEALHGLRAG